MVATDKRRNSAEYWEARLHRMGLGMDVGLPKWLSYGHVVSDLDFDGRAIFEGESKDAHEWPFISL